MKADLTKKKELVVHYLKNHAGAGYPLPAKTLGQVCGYNTKKSTGAIRGLVRELIRDGHPILSDRCGYWYSGSNRELQEDMNRKQDMQAAYADRISSVWLAARCEEKGVNRAS